ncbi:condensation domain-containing protein [Streptomyces sp. TRM64462]|uniref:condensation domain-containing protein n=1 Tax=Streptomyces sp. TRM64462 TaxID=2741726 RepID=UPI001586990A|nr:condensation domain-containing protein [Streptomyces sp. TRM64462]
MVVVSDGAHGGQRAGTRYAPFTGTRGVEAPLTWSQQEVWALIERAMPHEYVYNVVGGFRTPADLPLTVERCLEALSFFLERHESLRTVFPRDGSGRVVQRVLSEGRLPVEVVGTTPSDAERTAAAHRTSLGARRFSFADELPLALVLLVVDGRVWGGVYAFSHMAVDWYGIQHLAGEVTAYLRDGREPPPLPGDAMTPAALAAWQASPEGMARRERTLRHVESLYRDRPPLGLPPRVPGAPTEAVYRQARLRSRAAHRAVGRVAARTGVSTGAVVNGAVALLLRDLTGSGRVDLHLTSSQRFGPEARRMVATLMQETYFSVDVTDADLPEAVRRSWRAALTAYQNSGCDADGMAALLARLGGGPDEPLRFPYCVNDRRGLPSFPAAGAKADATPAASLLPDSALDWPAVTEEEDFYVVVDGDDDLLAFSLTCDTRHFTEAVMERFLRDLEGSLVRLADTPA